MVEPNLHRNRSGEVDLRPIMASVERMTGGRIVEMRGLETLAPRFVWRVVLDNGRTCFVKAETFTGGEDDALLLEAWTIQQAAGLGIPVPEVVGFDDSWDGFKGPIMVMTEAAGRPLPSRNPELRTQSPPLPQGSVRRAWRETGEHLRTLHGIAVEGFGRLDDRLYRETGAIRGRCATWSDFVLEPAQNALRDGAFRSALPGALTTEIEAALDAGQTALAGVRRSSLLHDDIGAKHVFADDEGHVTCIIDFGDRAAGDPAWDLANVWLWEDASVLRLVLDGYEADSALIDRIRLCAIADATRIAHKRLMQGRRLSPDASVAWLRGLLQGGR